LLVSNRLFSGQAFLYSWVWRISCFVDMEEEHDVMKGFILYVITVGIVTN
jgi:hypothetical protein